MDFTEFVLSHLPSPPARVLDVGCGDAGGVVPALAAAGYDALGVDPLAPEGPSYRQGDFREVEGGFDAVVAGRVLHHLHPLDESLDRLAELAPLLLVDEFAWDLIDAAAQDWYEGQYRLLAAAGAEPQAPPLLDDWREHHPGMHAHAVVLDGLRARYEERTLEWLPYLHRWLRGPASEALETSLVAAGAFPAIGWRWAGIRRGRR
ncbi:MAG TPA: methyltransferase domain-containing protein [Gaiellaceae bacterium]|nr:methyltransferase domain-containing protein [Gaiellaceae bacterium]